MAATQATAPTRKGFGCLGYGCVIAIALLFIVLGAIFFGARSAIRNAVKDFTTEQSIPVPATSIDPAREGDLALRLKSVTELFSNPKGSGEVTLSQEEMQLFLTSSPLKGTSYIELQGDTVSGTFSFPMKALGEWQAARIFIGDLLDRYVTGTAKAKLSVQDGVGSVTFESLALNGKVFDGDSLKEANEWVSGFLNSGENNGEEGLRLSRISSLKIVDGSVQMVVRSE
jgi:hypothetical protein